MQINVAYKLRIYPTKDQETSLNQTFGCCRFLWNVGETDSWVKVVDYLDQLIKQGSLEVSFKDVTDPDYLIDCAIDNEEPQHFIKVIIRDHGSIIAEYERIFDRIPSQSHFHNFVAKFLADPEYRQQYLTNGQWDGSLTFSTKTGLRVKPVCWKGIQRLNSRKGKIRFKEFAQLRTGGRDDFSRLSLDELQSLVSPDAYELATQQSWDSTRLLSCLRWIARGLKPSLAIRKIEVDHQIQLNAKRGKQKRHELHDF